MAKANGSLGRWYDLTKQRPDSSALICEICGSDVSFRISNSFAEKKARRPRGAPDCLQAAYFGWKAIERAEMVKASEKHMPSSAPWFFSVGKIASTIFTEPQA